MKTLRLNYSSKLFRNFNKFIAVIVPALFIFSCGTDTPKTTEEKKIDERPNIIVLLIDDMGYADLGSYGSEISTPNLDKLASGGIKFTNYHTAATCSPTRSMLLTGVDNHLTGMGNMIEIMADNQFDQPGYEGIMSGDVVINQTAIKQDFLRLHI
jgi:arylsulfatase